MPCILLMSSKICVRSNQQRCAEASSRSYRMACQHRCESGRRKGTRSVDNGGVGHVIGHFGLHFFKKSFFFHTLPQIYEGLDSLVTGFPVVNPSSLQWLPGNRVKPKVSRSWSRALRSEDSRSHPLSGLWRLRGSPAPLVGLVENRHGIVGGDDHKSHETSRFSDNLLDDERQAEISRSNCLNFQVPKASAARDLLLNFGQMRSEIGDGFKTWGAPNLWESPFWSVEAPSTPVNPCKSFTAVLKFVDATIRRLSGCEGCCQSASCCESGWVPIFLTACDALKSHEFESLPALDEAVAAVAAVAAVPPQALNINRERRY